MKNDPFIISVPSSWREFAVATALFALIFIALGAAELLFRDLKETPFGGLLAHHFEVVGPLIAGLCSVLAMIIRWLWHGYLLIAEIDAKLTVLNGNVATHFKEHNRHGGYNEQIAWLARKTGEKWGDFISERSGPE